MPIEKCLVEWNKSIAFRGRLDVEEGRDSSARIFPIEKSQGIHGIPKVNANNEFACQEREYRPSSVGGIAFGSKVRFEFCIIHTMLALFILDPGVCSVK